MIKSLSASSIDCYLRCPKNFKYEYIEKMMGLPSDALIIGEMVHLALKYYHERKDPFLEVRKKLLKPMSKEGIQKFAIVRKMVEEYIKNPLKDESLEFEKKFRIPFYNSKKEQLDVPISGIIDRLTVNGIIEYKTSAIEYTQEVVDKHIQATIYGYAYQYLKKKEGTVTFCVLNKKDYKVQILNTKRSNQDYDELYQLAKTILQDIKEEKFDPKPDSHCYWCSFRDICEDKIKNYGIQN